MRFIFPDKDAVVIDAWGRDAEADRGRRISSPMVGMTLFGMIINPGDGKAYVTSTGAAPARHRSLN